MNKKLLVFILLLVLVFSAPLKICAQNTAEWQPIFLLVTGGNTMDGIEASFQLNKCGNEDVIYIKFVNNNAHSVKIEWFDAVFTQELKWVNEERVANKKSLTLPANIEAKGECSKKIIQNFLLS